MPAVGIRFKGDYNEDGTLRLPEAEYTGIPNYSKDAIREQIAKKKIKINPEGKWTLRKETTRGYDRRLTQYGNFSIRENNKSGIYDMFDTYDFPRHWYMPNLNRETDKQIEIRDTIWGPNAKPELYNPDFTKKANGGNLYEGILMPTQQMNTYVVPQWILDAQPFIIGTKAVGS